MTDAVDISAEAIGRSIAELMGWLTGPDSGQNDGLITAANQLAALAKERDVAVRAYNDAQSHADHWALERDAARADALAAASREQEARAEAGRLREALEFYADTFCELGAADECCGKLDTEHCSGCIARAALAKEPSDE